eukprot:9204079-Alexandrium_andersonii.AAC.1
MQVRAGRAAEHRRGEQLRGRRQDHLAEPPKHAQSRRRPWQPEQPLHIQQNLNDGQARVGRGRAGLAG